MKRLPSAVDWAHHCTAQILRAGDHAIDATMGNGHDTLFLAQHVGPSGRVDAFDVQAAALEQTHARLIEHGCEQVCHLHHLGHEHMTSALPADCHGRVKAILFNLGYLPGADKSQFTRTETTLTAIRQTLDLLAPGGRLIVVTYPGHVGGDEEADAVRALLTPLSESFGQVQHMRTLSAQGRPPEFWAVAKR
jgi:16S rRNA C1402 N4-methylase RsmH